MSHSPNILVHAFTLDCPDTRALAYFYKDLLGWVVMGEDDEYVAIGPAGSREGAYPALLFQRNDDFVAPVWPEKAGQQQQMAHLDFAVDDLEAAVAHAKELGAHQAAEQFSDTFTVMLDPVGHPFCLCLMKRLFEGAI